MDWQLVASYFTVKSADILCSVSVYITDFETKYNTLTYF